MADDSSDPKLLVSIEARLNSLERGFQRASRTVAKTTGDIEKRTQTAAKRIEASANAAGLAMRRFAAGALGGIVALGVSGIVREVGDVAKGIASIGDEAKRAGVSARAFQEWKFVAEQNRIGIGAMTDGLKELNLRADEFVATGKGSAAEAFQRLGYGAEDLKAKLADPSALLLEIIGRLGAMDRAAQIRIADELFGGSAGERFVELIGQGEDGIRATIDRAHELGVVMSDDLIAKAAELDRRFNEISNTVGTALKSAIVSAADSLADFIDGFNSFEDQRSNTLQDRQTAIMGEKAGIGAELSDLAGIPDTAANRNANRRRAVLEQRMAALDAEENEIIAVLSQRTAAQGWKPAGGTWTPPTPPPGGFGSTSTSTDRDKVQEVLTDLAAEEAQLGRTSREQAIYNALQKAGITDADARAAAVRLAAGSLHDEELALTRAVAAADRLRDASRETLGAFVSGLREGKSATEALQGALDGLADKLLSRGLDQLLEILLGGAGTTGTGIAGMIFGGARAAGGPVSAGKTYLVGEHGPELHTARSSGVIIPNHRLGGGGSVAIHSPITVNIEGGSRGPEADQELADRVSGQLKNALRQVVAEELRVQGRPGGILSQ